MYNWEDLNDPSGACDDQQCRKFVHTEAPYSGRGNGPEVSSDQVQQSEEAWKHSVFLSLLVITFAVDGWRPSSITNCLSHYLSYNQDLNLFTVDD